VSMDGRMNVHDDTRIARSVATWTAREGWSSDPELSAANLVIAERSAALSEALRRDRARFQVVYEDALATVFLRN
jgi:hypothetical protein